MDTETPAFPTLKERRQAEAAAKTVYRRAEERYRNAPKAGQKIRTGQVRPEIQSFVDEIQQALVLLRRHL